MSWKAESETRLFHGDGGNVDPGKTKGTRDLVEDFKPGSYMSRGERTVH